MQNMASMMAIASAGSTAAMPVDASGARRSINILFFKNNLIY